MPYLVLVRHSLPEIDPARPARTWELSAEGRRRCAALAQQLAPYVPARLSASPEPKAAETARLAGEQLGVPATIVDGLEEHHRATSPFVGAEQFQRTIAAFFAEPERLVFGEETADEAEARFSAALDGLLAAHPGHNHVVVAHGTVIALFVSRRAGVEPLGLWRQLGLPSLVALELPSYRVAALWSGPAA